MSATPSGHNHSICVTCGKEYFIKGRTRRAKSKFCSKSCRRGKYHPMWKGGVTGELHRLRLTAEYKEWQQSVYLRDHWTCQKCGAKAKRIVAHHINSFRHYPKLRYDVNNGITLCRSCHKIEHSEIGEHSRFQKVA